MATAEDLKRETLALFKPPPRLNLSEWADEKYYLSPESSATPGRWKTIKYQRGVMDAITDPDTHTVVLKKSARIGWTKICGAAIGFYVEYDPCPIMMVQPTVEDAKGYSVEELAPMIRDVPVLARLIPQSVSRNSRNTLLHKQFNTGGSVSLVGANSGRGFRRVSRKVVIFDEADAYPRSAGTEGDPIKLGMQRSFYYWDRKTLIGSTPGLEGQSRIDDAFKAGDQRKFYVPCPHCGARDFLAFKKSDRGGHWMKWPKGKPELAYFVCSRGNCIIEYADKFRMLDAGEWRARKPFKGTASFHIWAAYSSSPNASWGDLATEFLAAEAGGPDTLKVFINTVLGETWQDQGEAPDWERLYRRREAYVIGTVPKGVVFLTGGVDVQRDRLVYEIVGWGAGRQSWSVDMGVIPGDTSGAAVWRKLDELRANEWLAADGTAFHLDLLAVDSGYNTQVVYNWSRGKTGRVIACKGSATAAILISSPSKVDVKVNGRLMKRGQQVWPIGVNVAKAELYGQLRQEIPIPEKDAAGKELPVEIPPGYCHFPEYGEDFFQQLTAEHLVRNVKRTGFTALEWQLIPGRENHFLDCRILARAAASLAGLDRRVKRKAGSAAAKKLREPSPSAEDEKPIEPSSPAPGQIEESAEEKPGKKKRRKKTSWLGKGRWLGGRDSWLGRKR